MLISTQIEGRAIEEGLSYFKVCMLSPSRETSISQLFENIQFKKITERFYAFPKQKIHTVPTSALENVKYERIDTRFLEENHFQNIQHMKSEVEWMWASQDKFREHGFGYAALHAGIIICWCTAEYVSKEKCGIGIETIQAYQNKGIATATTAHFVNECLTRNITPHWECDSRNMGSIRVAEKVGFEKIHEATFWCGKFLS